MKIFTDLHHGDLFFSLYRLFEVRLGWELYRPIGLDWFDKGYWKIGNPYPNPLDTARQYLQFTKTSFSNYKNSSSKHYVEDGIYYIYEFGHRYYQRGITLEKFKNMKFDIILSTFTLHDKPYTDLQKKFQPQAKIMAHLGNGGQTTEIPNVITSTPYTPLKGQNCVYVHQELDPDIYRYVPPNPLSKNIFSMVNCLPYPRSYNLYKKLLPECLFKAYGAGSPDGPLNGSRGVGEKMVEANIGWQLKPLGGLGHTAMGWFMSGRPVVTIMSEHRKTSGDALKLFEPGVTCLDLESHSIKTNCKSIYDMLENNLEWSKRALQRFKEIINYDEEEKQVRKMLEKIL